jgi:hypothetical protein
MGLNMVPRSTSAHVSYCDLVHSIDRRQHFGGAWISADGQDFGFDQLVLAVPGAFRRSTLGDHDPLICALCAGEKVSYFVTTRVVTLVQDVDSLGDRPIDVLPSLAMDVEQLPSDAYLPVSEAGASPYFTRLGELHHPVIARRMQ